MAPNQSRIQDTLYMQKAQNGERSIEEPKTENEKILILQIVHFHRHI